MAEKIMTFYKGEDRYSDGDIENEILEYLKTTPESELEKVFEKDNRWPVFYHLSPIRQNIINWYNIEKDASVLEIGAGMGAITGILCQKAGSVTAVELSNRRADAIYARHSHYDNLKIIVGNLNDIKFEEKFDYITLIGVLEYAKMFTEGDKPYQTFISNIKKLLKPGGKLLIAIENRYGLKYFCGASEDHTGKPFDGINGYKDNDQVRTFDKYSLEKLLKNSGLGNTRFYYPEPDYKLPNYIFTDKTLPSSNITSKINHYYQPGSFLVADEKIILDDAIKNGVYGFFANSFLIEASEQEIKENKNPNMVVFNNERKPEYRLVTAVYDDIVYKIPQSKKAIPHLYTIIENTKELKSRGIKVIENTLEDNKLSLPFVKEKTFDKVIIDLILDGKIQEAKKLVGEFNKEILKSSDKTTHNILIENKIVDQNSDINFGPILKKGYVDMTFFNCFYVGGEFIFMDQEWVQYDVPAEYVLFRSFYCLWLQSKEMSKNFEIEQLIKLFDINVSMFNIGRKLNENLCSDVFCYSNVGPFFSYLSPVGKSKQDYDNIASRSRDELQNQNIELTRSRDELQNQNIELTRSRDELQNQNIELTRSRDELQNQNIELTRSRDELQNQNIELTRSRDELQNQSLLFQGLYNETINSACWRVMSPVRVVFNIIKRILKSNKFTFLFYKFLLSLKNIGLKNTIFKIKNKIKNSRYKINKHSNNKADNISDFIKWIGQNTVSSYMIDDSLYSHTIDIILPVYNGYEFLQTCIDSVKKTKINYRLIIVNDNSTDNRVSSYLKDYKDKNKNVALIENKKNLGFVKSVNKALKMCSNHVVLLNTDTELPNLWLERLIKPILDNQDIASATPFTNAGTICSFPIIGENNKIFSDLDVDTVDNAFKLIKPSYNTLPTGVGFCMAMNYKAIKKIGYLDEKAFEKGYGEENDWCRRARKHGYRDVIVENLFVYHKHGGTFNSEEKQQLINRHLQIINTRYPEYESEVRHFFEVDTLKDFRKFISLNLGFLKCNRKNILAFDHNWGGGATAYLDKYIEQNINNENFVVVRYNKDSDAYALHFYYGIYKWKSFIYNITDLEFIIKKFNISNIFINELISYPNIFDVLRLILSWKELFSCKIKFLLHDYFCVCPSQTLINFKGHYCYLPNVPTCNLCLKTNNYASYPCLTMSDWRHHWNNFLTNSDEIIVFSNDSKNILKSIYTNLNNIKVVPHQVNYVKSVQREKKIKQTINIGFLGAVGYHKGSQIIREMTDIVRTNKMNVRFTLIGYSDGTIKQDKYFVETGKYNSNEVYKLVSKYDIDIFFISSIWPETFSYTTEEIIKMKLPIAVFNIGAPVERVKEYDKGLIISEIKAETALKEIINFCNQTIN